MESRKMLLMNLFSGKEWRLKCTELTCGYSGEEEKGMNGESSIGIYTLPYVKQLVRSCCITQRAQPNTL